MELKSVHKIDLSAEISANLYYYVGYIKSPVDKLKEFYIHVFLNVFVVYCWVFLICDYFQYKFLEIKYYASPLKSKFVHDI